MCDQPSFWMWPARKNHRGIRNAIWRFWMNEGQMNRIRPEFIPSRVCWKFTDVSLLAEIKLPPWSPSQQLVDLIELKFQKRNRNSLQTPTFKFAPKNIFQSPMMRWNKNVDIAHVAEAANVKLTPEHRSPQLPQITSSRSASQGKREARCCREDKNGHRGTAPAHHFALCKKLRRDTPTSRGSSNSDRRSVS